VVNVFGGMALNQSVDQYLDRRRVDVNHLIERMLLVTF